MTEDERVRLLAALGRALEAIDSEVLMELKSALTTPMAPFGSRGIMKSGKDAGKMADDPTVARTREDT